MSSNPERPSFASPCDLDELKHQVREKAIAELKEYIEKDGAWSKVHTELGSVHTVKSACGRFVLRWYFFGWSSSYSISYRGASAWHYYSNYEKYDCPHLQSFADQEREKAEPILKLHRAAMDWERNRKDCAKYAKALGINGHEWHPPGSVVPFIREDMEASKVDTPLWVILGGLCLLAIIIGVILL